MHLTRRYFLQSTGALAAYLGVAPVLGWPHTLRPLSPRPVAKGRTLVVLFLRGGADGLNLVVPHGDPGYQLLRKTIALGAPGQPEGVLDLDGFFGLHPRLAGIVPLFESGLAVAAHAVGYDKNSRSHFEEQDVWETGVVGNTVNSDGWVNRHLVTSQGHGPLRAVSIGDTLPRIMRGKATALAIRGLEDLTLKTKRADPAQVATALEHAYCQHKEEHVGPALDLLAQTARTTLDGLEELRSMSAQEYKPAAPYPDTPLAKKLMQVARLIKGDVGLEVAEVDLGGWDTHSAQGGAAGQMGNLAQQVGDALAAFVKDLGDRIDDTTVVTLSDFGRTAAENGTGGTDHGWANCMLVMGGGVARASAAAARNAPARKVVAKWPGLLPEQLHDGRDLLHTTDFRDVLGELVRVHLGNAEFAKVIPGHEFKEVGVVA